MTRILLAEDDDSLRGFLARALERAGYDVRSCADGDAAAAMELDDERAEGNTAPAAALDDAPPRWPFLGT